MEGCSAPPSDGEKLFFVNLIDSDDDDDRWKQILNKCPDGEREGEGISNTSIQIRVSIISLRDFNLVAENKKEELMRLLWMMAKEKEDNSCEPFSLSYWLSVRLSVSLQSSISIKSSWNIFALNRGYRTLTRDRQQMNDDK